MIPDVMMVPAPQADEYAEFYAGYVELARPYDPIALLGGQVAALRAVCGNMTEREALARYAPEKWSIKQVVGHLTDADRIFSYRVLRIGRGDQTPLASFDENFYVKAGEFDGRPLAGLLDEFESARESTLRLVEGMGEAAWGRRGVASGQPVTAGAIVYITAGHVEHHFNVLRERYSVPVPQTPAIRR